jgi:hypothetical protein
MNDSFCKSGQFCVDCLRGEGSEHTPADVQLQRGQPGPAHQLSPPDLDRDITKLASDQAAINALVQESGTWSKDFVALEGALAYTESGSFEGSQATS